MGTVMPHHKSVRHAVALAIFQADDSDKVLQVRRQFEQILATKPVPKISRSTRKRKQ